jgi:hypothetical protein
MTPEKIRQTIEKYKTLFSKIPSAQHADDSLSVGNYQQLQHCKWMLNKMEEMLKQADNPYVYDTEQVRGKFYRWLGFIQGVLWSQSVYSINDLKADNRD